MKTDFFQPLREPERLKNMQAGVSSAHFLSRCVRPRVFKSPYLPVYNTEMALNLVIDGYNLIGFRRGGLGDIEEERRNLLETLIIYKRLKKARITVVFDGPAITYPGSHPAGLDVVFSAGRQADAVIKELAARKGPGATVVTSDREIAGFAKARGSVVLGSDEFSALLDDALYEDMKGAAAEEEDAPGPVKKGPSRRLPKDERKKQGRIRKLKGK